MVDTPDDLTKWYTLTPEAVAEKLKVDPAKGLSSVEAQERLHAHGPNQLVAKKRESKLHAFLRQYRADFMQLVLVGTAIINQIFTRALGTTLVILGLTVINAILGLRAESKAEASLAALQKMMKNVARVRRGGQVIEIDAVNLVPGDVVLMETGNRVPADGRLFVAPTLEIEEAALTGESVASPKDTGVINKPDVPLGDRLCMAFMNTLVTRGRGEMIVTTTGMQTEIGHIAELLNKTEIDKTPLQKQLDKLIMIIAGVAGLTFLVMLFLGLAEGNDFQRIFLSGIALAIGAIPTGLPIVVTTSYSLGTRVLATHAAIVKRLPSVETLGSVSAICTDKTGTLTLNKMTAREFTIPGQNHYRVTGEGYSTQGQLLHDGSGPNIDLDPVLMPMALCADARLDGEELIGDPTEGALIVLAEKGGIDIEGARQAHPRVAEVPFDSDYKFMATFHNLENEQGKSVVRCFVKGAPDVLIRRSGSYWMPGGKVLPITEENRDLPLKENDRMAQAGERVMVVARRDFDPQTFNSRGKLVDLITDLTLLAMIGIVDPPRPEARSAIAKCHSAGIDVRMITGDHAVTSAAIAKELSIPGEAITGEQFSSTSDEELIKKLPDVGVVARVAPEDKIRLVSLLQERQEIVAMTGDGVNDAPALKKADIGVAMGVTGSEVAKEAAVMILTDDNFATIVKAVEYGRGIYDNLSKYIRFEMLGLAAFIISFLLAGVFGIAGGEPFLPLVILWLHFLVRLPIAIALVMDKYAPDLMSRKPRPLKQPVLTHSQWVRLAFFGLLIAVGTLVLEAAFAPVSLQVGLTMGFVVMALFNIGFGLGARSETGTVFNRDIFGDTRQLGLYGLSFLLTLLATQVGFLERVLKLTSLTHGQWLVCIGFAIALLLVDEGVKLLMRRSIH